MRLTEPSPRALFGGMKSSNNRQSTQLNWKKKLFKSVHAVTLRGVNTSHLGESTPFSWFLPNSLRLQIRGTL